METTHPGKGSGEKHTANIIHNGERLNTLIKREEKDKDVSLPLFHIALGVLDMEIRKEK